MRLYHAFPRKQARQPPTSSPCLASTGALAILESILTSGILLTYENLKVRWNDPYGRLKANDLTIEQRRFCVTALNDDREIAEHSRTFGPIALGFSAAFVRRLGGFPVFYLPSPLPGQSPNTVAHTDNVGVSMMYRLAEIRHTLEAVRDLSPEARHELTQDVVDLDNAIGAVRFLGNILYLTDHLLEGDDLQFRYYKQQEWRIIAGLLAPAALTEATIYKGKAATLIRTFLGANIASFIEDVAIVGGNDYDIEDVALAFSRAGLAPVVRSIPPA
jgi:hypothetical protein